MEEQTVVLGQVVIDSPDARTFADSIGNLAHRNTADLEATGMRLLVDTLATGIDGPSRRLTVRGPGGRDEQLPYDALIVGTGAVSRRRQSVESDGHGEQPVVLAQCLLDLIEPALFVFGQRHVGPPVLGQGGRWVQAGVRRALTG